MLKRLETIEEVISELGGRDAVKELTGRGGNAVPMWKVRNRFPPNTYAVMKARLTERGADAPDSLWGMAS